MAFAVGVSLALAVGLFATVVGLDRDRAFYPTVMLVIAFLYTLFAVLGGSTDALVLEFLVGIAFAALTVFGFKSSLWRLIHTLKLWHGLRNTKMKRLRWHLHTFWLPGMLFLPTGR